MIKKNNRDMKESQSEINIEAIKNYLALLGVLSVFIGMVSLDAYYQRFGLQYHFLNIPTSHSIYRGFTIITHAWYILVPFLLGGVWCALIDSNVVHILPNWIRPNRINTFIIVVFIMTISYPLAWIAGERGALDDLRISSTKLPKVREISLKDIKYPVDKNLHLLTLTSNFAVLVETVVNPDAEKPYTIFLDLGLINEFKTSI